MFLSSQHEPIPASPNSACPGLGDLRGNHFTIVLRDVSLRHGTVAALLEQTQRAAEQLRGDGFVNYFGEQRSGG